MRLAAFLLALPLSAATYYVSSAGNDANPGSIGSPWLTLNKALTTIACGDTVNIVANGSYVNGDGTIPHFSSCSSTTTIQSSLLANFRAIGYRSRPVTDASSFGKLTFSNGLLSGPTLHGGYFGCQISSIVGVTFTMGFCNGVSALANGSTVYMEIDNSANLGASTLPSPFVIYTKVYIKNCSAGCGTAASTMELAATSGGTSITPGACTGTCILGAIRLSSTIQVTAGSGTLTALDSLADLSNNTPVAVAPVNLQAFSTLPGGFSADTLYYIVNLSGSSFGLAATMGGSAIVPSTVGTGVMRMAATNAASAFKFDGLEFYSPTNPTALLVLGNGNETSTLGMVHNMEVSRSWLHGDVSACPSSGPTRGIVENGIGANIHDNYFQNFCTGEGQAIVAYGSPGPTTITNNFLEAAAENTMSGGLGNSSGVANSLRTFTGNYYYKPPSWKQTVNTGAPSGACWYDNTDPLNTGGEWYRNTTGPQNYQCGADFAWHATGTALPGAYTIKNMAEYKNGSYHTYTGNVFQYSWVSAQSGQAIAMHQGEDSGPGRANDHATITNNKALHVYQFTTEQSHCNTTTIYCAVFPTAHVVTNNLAVQDGQACGVSFATGTNTCGFNMHDSNMDGYPASSGLRNHNTVVMPDSADTGLPPPGYGATAFFASTDTGAGGCPLAFGFINLAVYENSITGYDFQGDCLNGGAMFTHYFSNMNYTNNALVGSNGAISYASPGSGNTFANFVRPANNAAMQYVSASTGDYHLSASSPYSASNGSATLLSTDGTDLGADIDAINAATSGAVAGTPTWAAQESFTIIPNGTSAVATYTRPGSTACSLTIYNAPARITANENADTNTSGKKLDTRTGNSVVGDNVTFNIGFNSALTPSTTYYYSQSCVAADTSVWTIVGSFTTLAGGFTTNISGNATVSGKATF